MVIYEYDKWDGMNENRITPITLSKFDELLDLYCHPNHDVVLYKNIIKPDFKIGFFFRSHKKIDSYLKDIKPEDFLKNSSFPDRSESILCYNFFQEAEGECYVLIPFLNSLFAISPSQNVPDSLDNCKKGYWKDQIKWLDRLPRREMWTDYPCLLIRKDIWEALKDKY